MAEQYWIGGFFVDASRNQITHNKDSQSLPPKALAVLTYLAENQGQVVSQEALLDHVWGDVVVSSNTLQRCIAQLRKALGDDGKAQGYIKTHAKRGYSLECDVHWQHVLPKNDSNNEVATAAIENDDKKPQNRLNLFLITALVLVVGVLSVYTYSPEPDFQFTIENIRPLTSTDNKELASIYSPDGEYVVFKRYSEVLCINNLWAKNLNTQEEFQLTKDLDTFGSLSFSEDGKTLAFVKEEDCRQPIAQKSCFQLQSLDFEKALSSPQTPTTLMECKNTEIKSAKWLNHDEIALLQKSSDRWQLISYSTSENTSKTLYALHDGNLINFDYSPEKNLIALTSIHGDGHVYIDMLQSNGQLMSSHRIIYPNEIAKFRYIYPNFSPLDNRLIFSTGRQLFTLSYQGEIANISVPLDEAMGSPVFHPNGKKMLAIKGHYDSDIVSVPLSQFTNQNPDEEKRALNYTVLERSILGEDYAKFQPNGDLIAYWSQRSGISQVWVTDGTNPQQLSHFPLDTFVNEFIWAADGESILVNASSELTRIYLDGRETAIGFQLPVSNLFHWDSDKETVLAMLRIQGVPKFVEINLANSDVRVINDKKIAVALKSENGSLIYMDHMDRFWQPGAAEDRLITALEEQGSERRFIIKDNVIYGINDDFQLWSYRLEDKAFNLIADLPNTVDYITDINQQQLLMSIRIAARKEVVELSLN